MNKMSMSEMDQQISSSAEDKEKDESKNRNYLFEETKNTSSIQIPINSFHYGSPSDTLETALRFKPVASQTTQSDPFVEKLLVTLENLSVRQIKSKPNKLHFLQSKLMNTNTSIAQETKDKELDYRCQKKSIFQTSRPTNANMIREKYTPNNSSQQKVKPLKSTSLFAHDEFKEIKRELSEVNKSKYLQVVRDLASSEECTFAHHFLENKQAFFELLSQIDLVEEVMPQMALIISNICRDECLRSKNILPNILTSQIMNKLITFITLFPSSFNKDIYSEIEVVKFFQNLVVFCETVQQSIALKSAMLLKKLLLALQYSIKGFKECFGFDLSVLCYEKTVELLQNCIEFHRKHNDHKKDENQREMELKPPDNVKTANIFPTKEDIFNEPQFLRKNVVEGSYRDVDHYIDVQFRLLREDFIAPLRSGIQQYCKSVTDKKLCENKQFENIRIHENVQILHGTITNGKFGHLVRLGGGMKNHTKRFMFGSLVIFTADNFNTLFCGTVINPVNNNLLIVEILQNDITSWNSIYGVEYIMVESEIYFEPYFHVLQALQQIDHLNFPMKEFIVNVKHETNSSKCIKSMVYPGGLNESQQKAFRSALTEEFVAIQGPPGTGKTHLAEYISKDILKNQPDKLLNSLFDFYDEFEFDYYRKNECNYNYIKKLWLEENCHPFLNEKVKDASPILIICYTNHALDQFLERLMICTQKIVRVGGQSKSDLLQKYNLKEIRKYWTKCEKYSCGKCRHNGCLKCLPRLKDINTYSYGMNRIREITFLYLKKLKLLESIYEKGILKMHNISCWMPPRFVSALSNGQFENWLLQGAYTVVVPDHFEGNTKTPVQTHQLISEMRQATAYMDSIQIYDLESLETANINEKFVVSVDQLYKKIVNLQKKLRIAREMGEHERVKNYFQGQIHDLEIKCRYISYMLSLDALTDLKIIRELNMTSNVWALDHKTRWMLYRWWTQHYVLDIKFKMENLEFDLNQVEKYVIEARDALDTKILQSATIVGITTTNAARLRKMLQIVGPEIVIVEEAAEVLEAHVVVALPSTVKKVVLIGDHKQLKPSTAVYQLARTYKLDVSLFERMINNGLGCQVLNTQHRMRPEIASLIAPVIYPDLQNSENVYNRPDIRGVVSNVFFVTHQQPEEQIPDTSSRRNAHEVNFIIALCQYFLNQGYSPYEITMLSTYAGQMTDLERERRRRNMPSELRITTVDNYQGEENDIVLLSLVRSNAEARIGFLSAENRVCVALSRAKNGLYIIGNMENLTRSSKIWPQIRTQLESLNAIGPDLPLGCKQHLNSQSKVSSADDFKAVPTSGCREKCNARLPCGHLCKKFCHPLDPEHQDEFKCSLPCERMACEEHRCPKKCGDNCGRCSVVVEKLLPCGHSAQLKCAEDPAEYFCSAQVPAVTGCGHDVVKLCSQKEAQCLEQCMVLLKCGHPCFKLCHYPNQNHRSEIKCNSILEKVLQCGHKRTVLCPAKDRPIICSEPCGKTFACGHECMKRCSETCGACEVLVEKTLDPCGHKLMMSCSVPAESSQCCQPCDQLLACGHPCPGTCSADCTNYTCDQQVQSSVEPACGHGAVYFPCHLNKPGLQSNSDVLLQFCSAPCRADLDCGHICGGQCGDCMQGRLHIPCSEMCDRILPCGHKCEDLCRNECPSLCYQPCFRRCEHSYCSKLCGEPCSPCRKHCERGCRHQQCSWRCTEDCDVRPCEEKCHRTLACGHPCPGYCGELCLPLCRQCSPLAFPMVTEPGDRFVVLETCGHIISGLALKKLLLIQMSKGEIPKCPDCMTMILNCKRHKDLIGKLCSNMVKRKETQIKIINGFVKDMKPKINVLQRTKDLDEYGEVVIFILDHLKKESCKYETTLLVHDFFKSIVTIGNKIGSKYGTKGWEFKIVVERCKFLLKSLSLRLSSMSSSDYRQMSKEVYRLKLVSEDFVNRQSILLSLKDYSLEDLQDL